MRLLAPEPAGLAEGLDGCLFDVGIGSFQLVRVRPALAAISPVGRRMRWPAVRSVSCWSTSWHSAACCASTI